MGDNSTLGVQQKNRPTRRPSSAVRQPVSSQGKHLVGGRPFPEHQRQPTRSRPHRSLITLSHHLAHGPGVKRSTPEGHGEEKEHHGQDDKEKDAGRQT